MAEPDAVQTTVRPTAFRPIDTLIVGSGLAGSLLAWELKQAGQCVAVVDTHAGRGGTSQAADRLTKPLTGPRRATSPDLARVARVVPRRS